MNEDNRFLAIAGLLQVLALVAGFAGLAAVMKLNGYPEALAIEWSPLAVFLREQIAWLFLVPAAWIGLAISCGTRDPAGSSSPVATAAGFVLSLAILLTFLHATFHSHTRLLVPSSVSTQGEAGSNGARACVTATLVQVTASR